MTEIIDGKALAQKLQLHLANKVEQMKEKHGLVPGLVVILVGDNPASQVYVRNKERSAIKAGFKSETIRLSDSISEEELIEIIAVSYTHLDVYKRQMLYFKSIARLFFKRQKIVYIQLKQLCITP